MGESESPTVRKHPRQDINKIYLYIKDPLKSRYQLLINGRETVRTKKLKSPKIFIDFLQTIGHVYENLGDYNPTKKWKVLLVFDDMIADMKDNKKWLLVNVSNVTTLPSGNPLTFRNNLLRKSSASEKTKILITKSRKINLNTT